ncbi:MAG: zinc metalloprotease HtpX [Pseudomonadota bacterium]|nr:zinc metalloprotease HtpX [Pseudomonadota bacterium]
MLNHLKTTLLLGLLTGVLVVAGRLLGGTEGMVLAFGFAVLMNFGAYWFSDKLLLRMYGAHEIGPEDAPEIWGTVEDLARRAGLPMPKVYLLPQPGPNAFATGRNPKHAAVAVTSGILQILTPEQLRGVLAHELGHIKNGDILISTLAATMAGAISMLANIAQWGLIFGGGRDDERGGNPIGLLVTMLVAPFAAMLIQLAISRSREYAADAYGAKLVGEGRPLAEALQRLEQGNARVPTQADPSTAHLFIVSPLVGRGISSLFRTHPHTEDRVKRLRELDLDGPFPARPVGAPGLRPRSLA